MSKKRGEEKLIEVIDMINIMPHVRQIYSTISQTFVKDFEEYDDGEKYQILFELSCKRLIRDYVIQHPQILDFINNADLDLILQTNKQDFLYYGRIINNAVIKREMDPKKFRAYVRKLEKCLEFNRKEHVF